MAEIGPTETLADSGNRLKGVNFPTINGKSMHLGVRPGDAAPRVLAVEQIDQLTRLLPLLDNQESVRKVTSHRGFLTATGTFQGVPVTLEATGTGLPMIDFAVRELKYAVQGPIAIVKIGTSSIASEKHPLGSVFLASAARAIVQNYDYDQEGDGSPYLISTRVLPNDDLTRLVGQHLGDKAISGVFGSADCFYNCQGRIDSQFLDFNEGLLTHLKTTDAELVSLDLETFKLLHLAKSSKGSVLAAAINIGIRTLTPEAPSQDPDFPEVEEACARAVLRSLISFPI